VLSLFVVLQFVVELYVSSASSSAGNSLMFAIQYVGPATAICSRVNGPHNAPIVRTPAAFPELMSCGESPIISA
jgi:hypothetical protein